LKFLLLLKLYGIGILHTTPSWFVAISDNFGNLAGEKIARKGGAKQVKSQELKIKRGSPLVVINMP